MVGEHCKVAIDAILDRIDERRLSRSLAADQVCLAVASIELAKEHSTLTESAGRRDRLTLHARGHLEMRQRHLAFARRLGRDPEIGPSPCDWEATGWRSPRWRLAPGRSR